MESDLSLIELSQEDNSLLQLTPNDKGSGLNNTYFPCSPLQIPRSMSFSDHSPVSPSKSITGNEDAGKQSSSSCRDSFSKENINVNKSELPKLSLEPQKLIRKKKGGYNLRKSLAWDRAFFTEEGVLDPAELSMINGSFCKPTGEKLSIVHEKGRDSTCGALECNTEPVNLQELEKNLFKELPESSFSKDRKIGGILSKKNVSLARDNVAPGSATKRKVLSTNDNNRRSKRNGCPQPVSSSSLKKPIDTTKAVPKELKVSKVPIPKPHSSVLPTASRSTVMGAGHLRRNQIAQPVIKAQKGVGSKGSSNKTSNVRDEAESGAVSKSIAGKSSVQQAQRNVIRSASEIKSLTNLQHLSSAKENNSLKVNPGAVLAGAGDASNKHEDHSKKITVLLPQKAECSSGYMPCVPLPKVKPSGLRMPSPSLGFFGQSKASASSTLLQTSNQPCTTAKCGIPNLRKLGLSDHIRERFPAKPGKNSAEVDQQRHEQAEHSCVKVEKLLTNDNGLLDINKKFMEPTNLTKSSSYEDHGISREENRGLETCHSSPLSEVSKSFEEFRKLDILNAVDVHLEVKGGRGLENPHDLSQDIKKKQGNEDFSEVHNVIKKSLTEDAQMQFLDGNSLVGRCNKDLNATLTNIENLMVVNDIKEQSGEYSELHTPSFVVEQVPLDNPESCLDDKSMAKDLASENSDRINSKKQYVLENPVCHTEDDVATAVLKNSGNGNKHDALVIGPPSNVAPFSDEWLAALDAAGEEILTMKGGAVQNSPQEKSVPEPGPWSPVKRKNAQGIGPFDCTKYTTMDVPHSFDTNSST